MIRLGGPAPPRVDPDAEAKKATEAVIGNVVIFGIVVGLIRATPLVLQTLGYSAE
jgi:hypothetical protein